MSSEKLSELEILKTKLNSLQARLIELDLKRISSCYGKFIFDEIIFESINPYFNKEYNTLLDNISKINNEIKEIENTAKND